MDDSTRLTRKQVIKRGTVVSMVVAVGGLEAAISASAAVGDTSGEVAGGVFSRAIDSRSAVVTLAGVGPVQVFLTPDAYVQHGTDGVVSDLRRFVPGERVAVRGPMIGDRLDAKEFQSVYTEEVGSLSIASADAETLEAAGGATLEAAGGPVLVPASIQTASGERPAIRSGETAVATIWTNPRNGSRTAVLMTPQN